MILSYYALGLISGKNLPNTPTNTTTLQSALTVLYEIVGAIAVLLLVIAALRYVVAAGDANKVSESKRMIAYTLVGLAVVALAATLVEVVLKAQ